MASHATHRAQAKSLHSKGLITDKQHSALMDKIMKAEQAEEAAEANAAPQAPGPSDAPQDAMPAPDAGQPAPAMPPKRQMMGA